jgi:Galactose oxidase, central domain
LVTTGDRIILFVHLSPPSFSLIIILCSFGGANDEKYYFNDTWSFDVSTRKWTELRCTGCVPSPRYRHTASLIDDVMYVFGGRVGDGPALGDLIALKLSSK